MNEREDHMKTTKKILSGILALSLSISSPFIVHAKSAARENVKTDSVQDRCLRDYEDLLLSFYSEKEIDYPDEYDGIYFNSATGVTTVCLTDLNDSKEYKKFFDESTVEFKEVDYSLDELNETYQFISDVMAEKNITTVAVSEKTNDLIVSVETDEDKPVLIQYLQSNGYNPDMVRFDENSEPVEIEHDSINNTFDNANNSRSSSVNYAYTGSKLYGGFSNNTTYSLIGTVGANAYNPSTGQYGIVTAASAAETSNISSFCNSSSVIMNNNSAVTSVYSGNCNAAFIPFSSANSFEATTTIKNGNITTCLYDTQPIVSPYMVGIDIVKYGGNTGRKTGTITNLSSSVRYGGKTLKDLIEYSMDMDDNDKGAPIGIEYTNGNGLHFMGIHSHGNGNDKCYATKYKNIEENLGVVILSERFS